MTTKLIVRLDNNYKQINRQLLYIIIFITQYLGATTKCIVDIN
jgi:hypothetical protein